MKLTTWYRGHSRQQSALDNFGIIWLTDDPYYAEVYAEGDGVVSVVYIDDSKINAAPAWEDIDFDYYFPDDESIDEFKQEGYNCYYFPASYDGEDFQCLALFDKSPVVKVEEYNKINENAMKLTEKDLKYIVTESVKRIVENFTATQMRNMLDIDDDDELNAAVETESKDDLLSEICATLGNGNSIYKINISFEEVKSVLNDFGFDLYDINEDKECYVFDNGQYEIVIYPTMFYERPNMIRIQNIQIF